LKLGALVTTLWIVLLAPFGVGLLAGDPLAPAPDPFVTNALPILKRHCHRCHSTEDPNGDLDLTEFAETHSVLQQRKIWENAVRMVQRGEMPPQDEPRLSAEESAVLTTALQSTLQSYDCSGEISAGRVTIRRLNRTEYNNTIRDLTAVDFRPADNFPVDDSGYGFDTIGDVLTLPPLLLEKYLLAAEQVVEKGLARKPDENGPSVEIEAQKMK